MKILFLLSLSLFTSMARAEIFDQECEFTQMPEVFDQLFDSSCLELTGDERCGCLKAAAETNGLVPPMDDSALARYQMLEREKGTSQFWNVYTQMTHGMAVQHQTLFGNDVSNPEDIKYVGCTANEIAEKFSTNVNKHVDKMRDLQEDALVQEKNNLTKCLENHKDGNQNACTWIQTKINKLQADLNKKPKEQKEEIIHNASSCTNLSDSKKNLEVMIKFYNDPSVKAEGKTEMLRKLNCLNMKLNWDQSQKFKDDYAKNDCVSFSGEAPVDMAMDMSQTTKDNEINVGGGVFSMSNNQFNYGGSRNTPEIKLNPDMDKELALTCTRETGLVGVLFKEYEVERERAQVAGSEEVPTKPQLDNCDTKSNNVVDKLCSDIDRLNSSALSAMQNEYMSSRNNCVSYPEFMLRKGVPGDELIKALSSAAPDKLANLLTVPTAAEVASNDKLVKQRLEFLKANPLVMKLTSNDPKARETLAISLKEAMAGKANGKSAVKLEGYLNFMKGKVKELVDKPDFKSTQKYFCDQMIDSFTSIQVSTKLPDPKDDGSPKIEVNKAVKECNIALNNQTAMVWSEISKPTQLQDIFQLEGSKSEKSLDEEFKELNNEVCGEKYKKHLSNSCPNATGEALETCRKKFLATTKLGEEQQVLDKFNLKRNFTQNDFNSVVNYSRHDHQDNKFKRWWNRTIGRRLHKSAVPYSSEMDDFKQDQMDNMSRIGDSKVPSRFSELKGGFSGGGVINEVNRTQNAVVNPGQVVPSFDQSNLFNPNRLKDGESVTRSISKGDQEFKDLDPFDQQRGLEEVKKYMDKNHEQKDVEESDLDEQFAKVEKRLEKEKERADKLADMNRNISHAPIPNQVNPSIPGGTGGTGGGAGGANLTHVVGANATVKRENVQTKVEKTNRQVNDFLNSIHDKSPMTIKDGVIDPLELGDKVVVSEGDVKDLKIEDQKIFVKISTNRDELEAYLKDELEGLDVSTPKIVTITDKTQGAPMPQMIFRIQKNPYGGFDIQSLPTSVPVERKVTLNGLNNTFADPTLAPLSN